MGGDSDDTEGDDDLLPRYRDLAKRIAEAPPSTPVERLREWLPTPARSDAFPGVDIQRRGAVKPDRLLASVFVLAIAAGLVLALGYRSWLPDGPLAGMTLTAVYGALWLFVGIYLLATTVWVVEALLAWDHEPVEPAFGYDDIQVRVLTVGAESVVQGTVDALPDGLAPDDRHVVAETPIDVAGATVHVVPDSFDCAATDKGRALEWARRNVRCDTEFVLFLDEDTLVRDFAGLPDVGVAQFREWPMFTGSYWAYWAEVLRLGYQTELSAFARLPVPLYAWGGGIAVRREVEEAVTWDYETLIEDTVFAWKAAKAGYEYEVLDTKFRNQAPPSVREMVSQRRRWISGSLADEAELPRWYRALYVLRNVAWAFSPLSPFLVAFAAVLPATVPGWDLFYALSLVLFAFTFVWVWRGWRYYDGPTLRLLPGLLLVPFVVAVHSLGAAYGLVSPAEEFEPTEKD
ncbi:glycosyltransferase family 2 protein [Halosegnis marinus]|uniref:Glycosyltransferase n=1 Tax=Halosegnis marinus TaxID=3034023 RepID=A0ABD5ZKU5_9EURY|nr:glycosyltransferase family 2 protein [Halosegnis sp. DT85]